VPALNMTHFQAAPVRRDAAARRPRAATGRVALVFGVVLSVALAVPAAAAIEDVSIEAAKRELLRTQALALENGEGVERDPVQAAKLYCEAARLGDAASQFNLGWMYSNGRGVERSDTWAAFFFHAAAEQGHEQAQRMLRVVGGAPTYLPDCMREPEPPRSVTVIAPSTAPRRPLIEPPPAPIRSSGPPQIVELVKKIATEFKVHPQLVLSVIEVESRFDTVALSPKNAKGLMQLIPETAARFGVARPYDAAQNIRGGTAYLQWLLAYFQGDVLLAAAAYNAGERAVERYRGVPPYAETRAYVAKVITLFGSTLHPFDAGVTEPSPQIGAIRAISYRR
jgi:TPR repeat protein